MKKLLFIGFLSLLSMSAFAQHVGGHGSYGSSTHMQSYHGNSNQGYGHDRGYGNGYGNYGHDRGYGNGYGNYGGGHDHDNDGYRHGYNGYGEWHHDWYNGSFGWWFLVGGIGYASEQAYIDSITPYPTYSYVQPAYVQPNYVYENPPTSYVPQSTVPVYNQQGVSQQVSPVNTSTSTTNTNAGWYCTTTGMFSSGPNDRCSVPWVSRNY